jgi:ribosomal protein S17
MAPSNILRSSLRLSSTVGRTATTRIATTFPPQTIYAAAINASNSRRSIWNFLSGDKPKDQAAKNDENAQNQSEEQVEVEEKSAMLEAQQERDAHNLASASTTSEIQTEPTPIIEQVKEVEQEILSSQSSERTSWPSNLPPPSIRQYPYTLKRGTVTSVGLMSKTVRVAYQHREWDRKIRKYYPKTTTYLVHDPRNSLREGDVIEFSSGAPRAPNVRHVVERIIAPFGLGVEDRPAVPTRAEREEEMVQKRMVKLTRKAGKVAEQEGKEEDVEKVTRRVVESKEHVGRIRGLVIERAAVAAAAQAQASA